MELQEVLQTKVYVKENSPVKFQPPAEYINPFIDLFGDKVQDFRVKVSDPVVNANADGSENVAYPRVNVEGIMGVDLIPGFKSVIGMIYALDPKYPCMKVYSGENVSSCMNLTIFNAENLYVQDMLLGLGDIYQVAQRYIEQKMATIETFRNVLDRLMNNWLTEPAMNEKIGFLIRNAGKALGTTPILNAVKLLGDNSSSYYAGQGETFQCNSWNLFNACTHGISASDDFLWKPNKTIALSKLFLN